MSIENHLIEMHKKGIRCTGIFFDTAVKLWKVNLRHPNGHYDYGHGATPGEAMADGVSRAKGEQGPANRPQHAVPPAAAEKPKPALEDMF